VADSAQRSKVNALAAELGRLAHTTETRCDKLEELELNLEQMILLVEEYGAYVGAVGLHPVGP
jgi:hypothetical protein